MQQVATTLLKCFSMMLIMSLVVCQSMLHLFDPKKQQLVEKIQKQLLFSTKQHNLELPLLNFNLNLRLPVGSDITG